MNDHDSTAIHVWHAASSSSQPGPIELRCEAWLDDSELERANQFRVATSRNQHVVGRGMAKRLLGREQIDPQSIRFAAEAHGKPYVAQPEEARRPFNIAHTDGLVMCGIASDMADLVGIDVEGLDRRTDPALADRYFSEPEIKYLKAYRDDTERRTAFLRIWTLKESFIKAIGTGLQTPLADFAFEEIDSARPKIRMLNPELDSGKVWRFFAIEPRPGFVGAIAVGSPTLRDIQLSMHRFDDWV